jgi:hypothetical protein
VSWRATHIVVPALGPCWCCKVATRFVQPDFETHLHPGACTEWAWRDFYEANAEVERRYPDVAPGDPF